MIVPRRTMGSTAIFVSHATLPEDDFMITISTTAKKKFLEVCEAEGRQGNGMRLIVRNGGTAQIEFGVDFTEPGQAQPDDVVIDVGEFKVYVEPENAKFLKDGTVDFVDNVTGSGFSFDAPHAGIPKPTGPVATAVQKVLDEKINPGVAMHGGHISLVAVEERTAYLRFGGGCQGCGMVDVTLKQGVEKMLFEDIPEITKVMDVTDHAAGANPYYQPAK